MRIFRAWYAPMHLVFSRPEKPLKRVHWPTTGRHIIYFIGHVIILLYEYKMPHCRLSINYVRSGDAAADGGSARHLH